MNMRSAAGISMVSVALALGLSNAAGAAPRYHGKSAHAISAHAVGGVRYAARSHGGQALVSDGPGTGFGFHRLPGPYRVGAIIHRERQANAVRDAVETDALTSGGFRSGFLGDDVASSGSYAGYGVFSGADGYGSPYFAGYYGRGDGADLGPLGHTYADD